MDKGKEGEQVELVSLRAKRRDSTRKQPGFLSLRVKFLLGFTLLFVVTFAAAYYGTGYLHNAMLALVVAYIPSLVVAFLISGALTRPITALTRAFQRVAEGDYSQGNIPKVKRVLADDEITAMAEAFQQMVIKIADREMNLKEQMRELTMHIHIDQLTKAKKVAEITESEYFQQLQEKAHQMRETRREK